MNIKLIIPKNWRNQKSENSNPFDACKKHQDNFSNKSPIKCDINEAHLKVKPLESFKNMDLSEISDISNKTQKGHVCILRQE